MNKKHSIVVLSLMIFLCPLIASAVTFDDMLVHHPSKRQPFWGYRYENIKWVSHTPTLLNGEEPYGGEADFSGQVDTGKVDLDNDNKAETVKVIWNGGVTDHILTIEVYKDGNLISTLKGGDGSGGIQCNFRIADIDGDGKKEIIIWSGLWDFRLPGEDGLTDANYEGHSAPHRYIVATYKLLRGQYYLWEIYTTKRKYEPFCEEQPKA